MIHKRPQKDGSPSQVPVGKTFNIDFMLNTNIRTRVIYQKCFNKVTLYDVYYRVQPTLLIKKLQDTKLHQCLLIRTQKAQAITCINIDFLIIMTPKYNIEYTTTFHIHYTYTLRDIIQFCDSLQHHTTPSLQTMHWQPCSYLPQLAAVRVPAYSHLAQCVLNYAQFKT